MSEMLTPEDIAVFLKINPKKVLGWLQEGHLPGINLDGEWRVSSDHFEEFLKGKFKADQLRILKQLLRDPDVWAKQLARFPDLMSKIEGKQFPEGSVGAFLKNSLEESRARQASGKVARFRPSKKED